jgi:hypothetical protein
MDFLSIILFTIAGYAVVAALLFLFVTRLAARLAEVPSSLDCRDSRHVACAGCACSCHP